MSRRKDGGAAAPASKTSTGAAPEVELSISPLKRGRIRLRLVGETPLYYNAMSAKARRDLLLGGRRKTAAERKEIKHDPVAEFRASVYRREEGPTLLCFPAAAIKAAMATAALETEGVTKTSVQRLIFLPQRNVPVWGTPRLAMDVVRSADMGKTPDVRSRAFLERWASGSRSLMSRRRCLRMRSSACW